MPPKPKHVLIVETDQEFESAREAARHVNGDYSAIYRCLRKERETHQGFHYQYIEEEHE